MTFTEFDIIEHYFKTRTKARDDVLLGIGDDCAILQAPKNKQIAVSVDTSVAGVHFPHSTHPKDIGYKSLAVSLSDLAAMSAEPAWVSLSLTLPEADESWLKQFSDGLFELIDEYSLQLITGDISHGPLSISTYVHGFVHAENAMRRDSAKPGDLIYVTGTLGDAGLALKQDMNLNKNDKKYIEDRLNRPTPRVNESLSMQGLANAAIDISDGLAADLGHVLKASRVGATILIEKLPLSHILTKNVDKLSAVNLALTAGDD